MANTRIQVVFNGDRYISFGGPAGLDWFALLLCAGAFFGLMKWKWSLIPVVLGSDYSDWFTTLFC